MIAQTISPVFPAGERAEEERWEAVLRRDPAADGGFVFAVRSTGVYCRPSCPARRPRRENVAFHPDGAAARAAGFRPCLRCRPDEAGLRERQARLVAESCRRIDAAEAAPPLAELAAAAGLSPYHFHRLFRSVTGLTPRGYAAGRRAERLRRELAGGESVTGALYGAGFGSSGHFYAAADGALGMTPAAFRDGGAGAEIRFATTRCSLGALLVAASDRGVCAILLGDAPEALREDLGRRFPRAALREGEAGFGALVAQVVALIEAPGLGHDLPLDLRGTTFQQRVWQALRQIPAGRTESYAEVAARIGAPGAARAVARACAGNALAVAIPCHRVVRGDGGLSGYRWGAPRKRALLEREGARETLTPAAE